MKKGIKHDKKINKIDVSVEIVDYINKLMDYFDTRKKLLLIDEFDKSELKLCFIFLELIVEAEGKMWDGIIKLMPSLALDKENPSMFSVAAHQKDSSSFQCKLANSSITYLKFNESTNKYEYRHDNEIEQIDDKESAWAIVKDQIDNFSQSHDYRTYEVLHYRNMQYEKLDAKISRKDDGYLATYQAKDESSNQNESIWDYSVDINKKGFITKNLSKIRSYTGDDPRPIFIWNDIYCIDYSGKYTINSSDEDYLATAARFVEEAQIENYWATFKKQGLI